jgi:hypothetical protein
MLFVVMRVCIFSMDMYIYFHETWESDCSLFLPASHSRHRKQLGTRLAVCFQKFCCVFKKNLCVFRLFRQQ